jgi:(p)ppGpp synthase/HD superfamily hydrolase
MSSLFDQFAVAPPSFIRDSATLREAFALARCAHSGQERKDPGSPYIVHAILVAERLARRGYREAVVAAALLHDVVERSELTVEHVAARFGCEVADLVATLTDDSSIPGFVERKNAQRQDIASAGEEAQAIFAADRASNAIELTRLLRTSGAAAAGRDKVQPETRLGLWLSDLETLEEEAPELDLLPEMRAAIRGFAFAVASVRPHQDGVAVGR